MQAKSPGNRQKSVIFSSICTAAGHVIQSRRIAWLCRLCPDGAPRMPDRPAPCGKTASFQVFFVDKAPSLWYLVSGTPVGGFIYHAVKE